MSIDGVGSRTSYLGAATLNLRKQMEDLQQQLASGKVSDTYAGQGIDRGFAVNLRAQISSIGSYASTATNVTTRINVANLSLQGMIDIGAQTKKATSVSSTVITSNGQTSAQITAQSQFASAVSLLNTQSGGRYLFSGRAIDTPPTASAQDILEGNGAKAGLKQLINERKLADLGTSGLGRIAVTAPSATSVQIADDASPFGLKINNVTSSLTGATLTPAAGSPGPVSVALGASNPNAGDTISYSFNLPDGTTESIKLTATTTTPVPAGSFAIGATPAATAANLQAALTTSLGALANTSLVAASAVEASDNFFNASPPLRVNGPPFDSATSLVNGTAANTVTWYTGENGVDPARGTAVAQVDQSITVQYGARANEQAFRTQLQNIAVYAAMTTAPGDANANAQVAALSQRVGVNLTPPASQQSIQNIQAEFAGAQAAIKTATDRQTQVKGMAQTMLASIEGISNDEVATKILALQTSLSASYQTTAMLYQTSLTKFL